MTKQEIERLGADIIANDSSAIIEMKEEKSKMQQALINQLSTSEVVEMLQNTQNKNVINKLYQLGAQEINKKGRNDKNYYITSQVVGTILKELYEDQNFVSVDSLYTIISKIKEYE